MPSDRPSPAALPPVRPRRTPPRGPLALALVLWTVLAPGLVACTSPPDKRILQYLNQQGFGRRYQGDAQEQNYVTVGDTINFFDVRNSEVRGTERVDVDGTISIPEVGSVHVAGLTREETETFLTQKLGAYYAESDVKVTIQSGAAKVYYVIGEVETQGAVPYMGDTTVLDAVLTARPKEYTGNLGRVRLIRADPRDPLVLTLDLADIWENGDSTYNVQVKEFDIVYVPPTLLKQLADFASAIIVPITSVLQNILATIFQFNFRGRFNRFVY